MGKDDFLTPKAISNRIKAKGLQKLRWYCQMCQKQCRDENGFRNHCRSDSHRRQMEIFRQNPNKFLNTYSKEFEEGFLNVLKARHHTSRVKANRVYQEFIANRHHIHMNATAWGTLSAFVQYLGRTGKCHVDEAPDGWYVSYIQRDPEIVKKQEARMKKEKMEMDEEQRQRQMVERQMRHAQKIEEKQKKNKNEGSSSTINETLINNNNNNNNNNNESKNIKDRKTPLKFSISNPKKKSSSSSKTESKQSSLSLSSSSSSSLLSSSNVGSKRSIDQIEPIRTIESSEWNDKEHKEQLVKRRRTEHWLTRGIVVKVTKGQSKWTAKKGVITKVSKDREHATLTMLQCGSDVEMHQKDLETVIPKKDEKVKIVRGSYRKSKGELIQVEENSGRIHITDGAHKGTVVSLDFNSFSKLF